MIVPSGPHEGERYRHDRHVASRLWFDALDSGLWTRHACSAPQQNGKSLMAYVLPVCWHLFEVGERVIIGLPDMAMAQDKWVDDFLPVIEASPTFRELLPVRGEGSRGGQVKREVRFRNGASLRFMTAGSSDKGRAGKTTRVVAITETDGMDQPGSGSRESDPISQIEGRTRAYGRTGKRVYLECTVSWETGRIWQEIQQGTCSRIARPCPHCGDWVSPEREHLVGWRDAPTEEAAAAGAHWICPACTKPWTDEQRRAAWPHAVLVHRGQQCSPHAPREDSADPAAATLTRSVRATIVGPLPETQTLGFRWSAIDNPFMTAPDIGAEEWRGQRKHNRQAAERELRQWIWCLPDVPQEIAITPLDPDAILQRTSGSKRGIVPEDTIGVAVGIDTGKRKLHWCAVAARRNGSYAVVEYGEQSVESDRLGITAGLKAALQQLRGYLSKGWPSVERNSVRSGGMNSALLTPSQVWIDSGYWQHTDGVYAFCGAANTGCSPGAEIYRPSKGYGERQKGIGRYYQPRGRSPDILHTGTQYHLGRIRRAGRLVTNVVLVHVNADAWKSEVHQRLAQPVTEPGALTLYETADAGEHQEFRDHLTAERQIETWIPGRGPVTTWENPHDSPNHYLDACYAALAAADLVATLAEKPAPKPTKWFASTKKRPSGER